MKWVVCRIVFDYPQKAMAADLIGNIFADLGIAGVVVDDPDLDPGEGWGEDTRFRPEQHAVTGYIADNDQRASRLCALSKALESLPSILPGIRARMEESRIDEADWAGSWKTFFWPAKIGDRIVIKPTWREYKAQPGEIVVEIDPGMAFGTGTHATTALCIRQLEKHIFPGCRFLDVGTGSGVLMVSAAKLGAGQLSGVDNDKVAVDIARSNLDLNRIACTRDTLILGNLVDDARGVFDVVTANILSEVIMELLDDLPAFLMPGGVFIASGIIRRNSDGVMQKMVAQGFQILENTEMEEWVAISARFPGR